MTTALSPERRQSAPRATRAPEDLTSPAAQRWNTIAALAVLGPRHLGDLDARADRREGAQAHWR
jgi:hypothetical protein